MINTASDEYFRSVKTKQLQGKIIKPVFLDEKNGQFKVISFYAKKARGLMSRYIIENRLTRPEQLTRFNSEGYFFDAEASGKKMRWSLNATNANPLPGRPHGDRDGRLSDGASHDPGHDRDHHGDHGDARHVRASGYRASRNDAPPFVVAPATAVPVVTVIVAIANLQFDCRHQRDLRCVNQSGSHQRHRKRKDHRLQR